ncbi:multiple sugar transport system permease protein [Scopulibacillus darangshiensis]|uniref:Multiple sugar transport system permease protein n=1 Tax=Scopulibacillus darangshiensis TaxID=442528 RepID=A0A4R2P9P9_9BACL|nr:sugar ABC transporter permease [Scopulibacillus darangshiensis]TCP30954.1 multiple sugar transport system permease protein [Scopulibacillus darangshiensis]
MANVSLFNPAKRITNTTKIAKKTRSKGQLASFLFILPFLLGFTLFCIIPIVYGIIISLFQWNLLDKGHIFLGLENYKQLFISGSYVNGVFFSTLKNTALYAVISVPLFTICSLVLAILVNNVSKRFTGIFRAIFFFPYVLSLSVVGAAWALIFNPGAGFLNALLNAIGIDSIQWNATPAGAWTMIIVTSLWWGVGFNMILFINALNNVSEELYEAANVDGASAWFKFKDITLPSIQPIMLYVVIMSTIGAFNLYGQPLLLTAGGPGTSTKVTMMSILDEAFIRHQLGSASAMAIVLGGIIGIFILLQYLFIKRKEG